MTKNDRVLINNPNSPFHEWEGNVLWTDGEEAHIGLKSGSLLIVDCVNLLEIKDELPR